jgi:predicted AAA+ superfamily ATPase
MLRLVRPWFANAKKRLVKQPKIFVRDTGIFHALQSIHSFLDFL